MNVALYVELMLSMNDSVPFDLVEEATMDNLPEGNSHLAWTNLKRKYEGNSVTDEMVLKKEFYSLKMTSASKDPNEFVNMLDKKLEND